MGNCNGKSRKKMAKMEMPESRGNSTSSTINIEPGAAGGFSVVSFNNKSYLTSDNGEDYSLPPSPDIEERSQVQLQKNRCTPQRKTLDDSEGFKPTPIHSNKFGGINEIEENNNHDGFVLTLPRFEYNNNDDIDNNTFSTLSRGTIDDDLTTTYQSKWMATSKGSLMNNESFTSRNQSTFESKWNATSKGSIVNNESFTSRNQSAHPSKWADTSNESLMNNESLTSQNDDSVNFTLRLQEKRKIFASMHEKDSFHDEEKKQYTPDRATGKEPTPSTSLSSNPSTMNSRQKHIREFMVDGDIYPEDERMTTESDRNKPSFEELVEKNELLKEWRATESDGKKPSYEELREENKMLKEQIEVFRKELEKMGQIMAPYIEGFEDGIDSFE